MKRLALICTIILIVLWGMYAVAGRPLANAISERFGQVLLKLGEGKVASAGEFLRHRFLETAWLLTLIVFWMLLHGLIHFFVSRSNRWQRHAWIVHALAGLLALNVWTSQATHTVAFWAFHWEGGQTQNLTRFHMKRILAREQPATLRAALVGSSQTRAQIDEAMLNKLLGSRLRTTDLAYPGAKALDVLLMHEVLSSADPNYLIWYVSEADFHSGSVSEVIPNFLKMRQLPDLFRRDAIPFLPPKYLASGLLGDLLPVFRLREVFTQRILGPQIGTLQQAQYNAALESDLSARARRAASLYRVNEESRMHQRAMEDFIRRCQLSGQKVILLAGQLHPEFQRALDPSIRPQMLSFLRMLKEKYPNVTLIENMPAQPAEDYDDLTHVNRAAQERFSQFLASQLDAALAQPGDRLP